MHDIFNVEHIPCFNEMWNWFHIFLPMDVLSLKYLSITTILLESVVWETGEIMPSEVVYWRGWGESRTLESTPTGTLEK